MKLNFRLGIKILLPLAFVVVLYFVFINTDLFVPSQKEPPNNRQLKTEIISQISKDLTIQDTLYLVTQRMFGVCGNDPRYDGNTNISEKIDEIKYNLDYPYILKGEEGYEPIYMLNGKTIITGNSMDNRFSSDKYAFEEDSLKFNKMLDIEFPSIERDKVKVEIVKYGNKKILSFTMVYRNDKWVKE